MSRFLKASLQALDAYTPGEQPRDQQYIKLNTNESPYPPAPSVVEAMNAEQVELLRLYSDPTARGLKEKLAELYGVKPENVFVSNGSDEVLNFAFLAFGEDGVVFPEISYGFYEVFGDLYALEYEKIPLNEDFSISHEDYCGKGKMVVIANPNAPTGMSISLAQIFGGETALPLLAKYDNLLITRTFSKSRCLAGGRLGYGFGSPEIIADLEKIKYSTNPYNVNRLTLLLGEKTVEAEEYYREKCAEIIETRQWTAKQLEDLGFTVLPSQTNFVFAKTGKMDGGELYEKLKARGILVRHFSNPKISQFNRITIGTKTQMETLIATLKEVLV